MRPRSRSFRPLFLETHWCLHCGRPFLVRCRELVYCSVECGRLARGLPLALHPATHCMQGHALTAANTYRERGGRRRCRTCKRRYDQTYYARHREAA